MASAFRDELEAARARAEVLREQNDELRDEVERLRQRSTNSSASTATKPGPSQNPELEKLAENTLQRLEHLSEEADGGNPVAQLDSVREPPHPPRAARVELVVPTEAATLVRPNVEAATPAVAEEVVELRQLRAELVKLRQLRARVPTWITVGFLLGALVGIALDHALR
jgi:hypothetical protein